MSQPDVSLHGESHPSLHRESHPGDAETLRREAAACLPVFPMLSEQLKQTSLVIEQGAETVCGNFQDIADRARENVARTMRVLGGEEQPASASRGDLQSLISSIRQALKRAESAALASQRSARKMEAVQQEMKQVNVSLNHIQEIVTAINMLGINAMIEAARAGEHGRTFSVVADQTRKLGKTASQVSKAIQQTAKQLRVGIKETSEEFQSMTSAGAELSSEVNGVLDLLVAGDKELRRSIEESAHAGEALVNDISAAVVAMQFQDRASQQIGHVAEALEDMEQVLGASVSEDAEGGAALTYGNESGWAERLMGKCTMHSQREVVRAHIGAAPAAAEADDFGDNIELF